MEKPQRGNGPKSEFGFLLFFKNYRKSLKNWKVLRDFRIFWIGFRYIYIWLVSCLFWVRFFFFWVNFRFSKNGLNPQFVDWFPLFLGTFKRLIFFWARFRFSKKTLNSISMLIGFLFFWVRISSFFGCISGFQKSFKFLVCWSGSSLFFGSIFSFFGPFPVFKKVINSQFVDQFPLFFNPLSKEMPIKSFMYI